MREIKDILDLFEGIRGCTDEDWKHNRVRMNEILNELVDDQCKVKQNALLKN